MNDGIKLLITKPTTDLDMISVMSIVVEVEALNKGRDQVEMLQP